MLYYIYTVSGNNICIAVQCEGMKSGCNIMMFGDKDFTVYFGLVYNEIRNLTLMFIYLKVVGRISLLDELI